MDTAQLEKLLNEGKTKEAKSLLEKFFQGEWSSEDRGAVFVNFAHMYIKIKNKILEEQNANLAKIVEALKLIDKEQRSLEEETRLAQLRADLEN